MNTPTTMSTAANYWTILTISTIGVTLAIGLALYYYIHNKNKKEK